MIERTFQSVPDGTLSEADQQSFLINLGWSRAVPWQDLLQSRRILIISEAGAGKTYECQLQAKRLWDEGAAAFFIELASLANHDLRDLLDAEEEERLDAWLTSQSETATFFLDSIDELKLTLGSFNHALKRLRKDISSQLHRTTIVITTRPIPIDEQTIRRILPIPSAASSAPKEEGFATIAMRDVRGRRIRDRSKESSPDWRTVALMPLSDPQIVAFARNQGVQEPELLLLDLQRRNAQAFARRPQDLIELCADWREHKRIRSHRDQVATNIRIKLQPREDRAEPAELSPKKAIEGASRLALAMQVTRRLTIRHSAAADGINEEAALEPANVLDDWNPDERKALLERPLFGFASYGRVRFHHRSVAEYLAAERLLALRESGMPFRALKRLLFAETKGKIIARPSKRPIAGWLALTESGVFELLRDHEPAVLLDEGDPESLTQIQQHQALRAYAARYGPGGWRGLSVPRIQIHRFSSPALAEVINQIWAEGVENPDVREILIALIEAGRIEGRADIAHGIACDPEAPKGERIMALNALVALDDTSLCKIVDGIAAGDDLWPDRLARAAVPLLFPRHMPIDKLQKTLAWVKGKEAAVGDLTWHLPDQIKSAELRQSELEALRDALVYLISDGLVYREEWPRITSNRTHLGAALAATCVRGIKESKDDLWLDASVLALRLHHREYGDDGPIKVLHEKLKNLENDESERLFWAEDRLVQSLQTIDDPWNRLAQITHDGGSVELLVERDLEWVKVALSETRRGVRERALLLEAAMQLYPDRDARKEHVEALKPLVADAPSLVSRIEDWLKLLKRGNRHRHWEKRHTKRRIQEERRKAKDRANWVQFWRLVANQPDQAFSSERGGNTAWNLWKAMRHDGDDSRSSGWNRRFIEEQFDRETANRLRLTLMTIWRNDRPTLASERPQDERGTTLFRWQLGLAAIYAEAEDPNWATKLNKNEAALAARYTPIELNGFPSWINALVTVHPDAVDQTLGEELTWELTQAPDGHSYSSVLQGIGHAEEAAAHHFLPRLLSWLNANGDSVDENTNIAGMAARLRYVTSAILRHGDEAAHLYLHKTASQRLEEALPDELLHVWLLILMRLNPASGVSALEHQIKEVEPGKYTTAVDYFADLFGDRHDAVSLNDERFTPQLLLRLVRLAYRHVRTKDDAKHEETFTPDTRDDAQHGRDRIVGALFDATGEDGWAAKLEMAADPPCAHFKDRILAVAAEKWAEEIDAAAFDEIQAVALDRTGEAPASTNEAMFAIMKHRLSDLSDLLLRDDSPREAWAGISDEKIMRREIARELRHKANGVYKVDQEAVTSDEKETDIRLRSTVSDHEAVIELKLGDRRTARDLRDTIEQQLVKKYLAAENSRSGALLVTLSKDRKWEHPESGERIAIDELMSLLHSEAERVQEALGGAVSVDVHLLDLRPRLPLEK